MSITATQLGMAPITLDWSQLMGQSLPSWKSLDKESFDSAWKTLTQRFSSLEVGFYNAPSQTEISGILASESLAKQFLAQNQFTDCLFIGIGGSSLGPISLLAALKERTQSAVQFHFLENPDPYDWTSTVKNIRPETTLVCVVTKSGATFETTAQMLCSLEWLGKSRWKTHFMCITDPAQGDLRQFAQQEGLTTLPIHPSIGGRFSIFSSVGLFPAALAGLDVQAFLLGAKQVRDYMEKISLEKNPIFLIASELLRFYPQRSIHVCMPYATRLRTLGLWFTQLWGESLGKEGKGFTPLSAVGPNDQHSLLQLLRDGPDDKVTFFLRVEKMGEALKIPKAPEGPKAKIYPAFYLLQGHTLQDLLKIEYQATSLVLSRRARPHFSISLDTLDERNLGALYFFLQCKPQSSERFGTLTLLINRA